MADAVTGSLWTFLTVGLMYHVSWWVTVNNVYLSLIPLKSGEVLFDRNHPGEPPDIIFSPKDENTEFSPRVEELPVSLKLRLKLMVLSLNRSLCQIGVWRTKTAFPTYWRSSWVNIDCITGERCSDSSVCPLNFLLCWRVMIMLMSMCIILVPRKMWASIFDLWCMYALRMYPEFCVAWQWGGDKVLHSSPSWLLSHSSILYHGMIYDNLSVLIMYAWWWLGQSWAR